jgi:hypothetical protein
MRVHRIAAGGSSGRNAVAYDELLPALEVPGR